MRNFFFLGVAALCLMACQPTSAADELQHCAALGKADSYGHKFKEMRYMLPGKDGWFFRSQADLFADYTTNGSARKWQKKLVEALLRRGTELVIIYPPTRGMAAAAFLPDRYPLTPAYDAQQAAAKYNTTLQKMQHYGVNIIGLAAPQAKEQFFYRTDQHWTSAGAREMAHVVAEKIKTMPVYAAIRKQAFTTTDLPQKNVFEGSFNRVFSALCQTKAPPETDQLTTTTTTAESANAQDLFGEQALPDIVLVGTSNSKKSQNNLNFDGFLKQELSADILNEALSGGGLDHSIRKYFASENFRRHPPKILLWEIPGYYNLSGEKMRKLLRRLIRTIDPESATAP